MCLTDVCSIPLGGFFVCMHIKYFSIIAALIIGITSSVWYAQSKETPGLPADTVSGFVTQSGAEGDLVEPAPSVPRSAVVSDANANASTPESHTCETASLKIGNATYAPCATGATLLEIMRTLESENLVFSGKEHTGLGYFMESINGERADTGFYWSLYKNGTYSEFGASAAQVMPGDEFEWKLEKSY